MYTRIANGFQLAVRFLLGASACLCLRGIMLSSFTATSERRLIKVAALHGGLQVTGPSYSICIAEISSPNPFSRMMFHVQCSDHSSPLPLR